MRILLEAVVLVLFCTSVSLFLYIPYIVLCDILIIKFEPFILNFNNRIIMSWLGSTRMHNKWLKLVLILILIDCWVGIYIIFKVYLERKLEFWTDLYKFIHRKIMVYLFKANCQILRQLSKFCLLFYLTFVVTVLTSIILHHLGFCEFIQTRF